MNVQFPSSQNKTPFPVREVRNHSLSHFLPKVHDLAMWLNSLLPLKTLNIPFSVEYSLNFVSFS